MSDTTEYGKFYWCVQVTTDVSPDGKIYLMADEVVLDDGILVFVRKAHAEKPRLPVLALAPSQWTVFYAASMLDGSPVAVQHWKGEVER